MDSKKKNLKDYQKDSEFFDLSRADESLNETQKEEFYGTWRKKLEELQAGMKYCATKKIMTRRDLLGKGLTAGFATALFAPSITKKGLSLFNEAEAQTETDFGVVGIECYGGFVLSTQLYCKGPPNPAGHPDAVKAALGIRINNTEGTPQAAFGALWKSNSEFIAAIRTALGNDNALFTRISDRVQTLGLTCKTADDNGNQTMAARHLLMQVLGAGLSTSGVAARISGGNYRETHPAPLSILSAANAAQAAALPGTDPVGFRYINGFQANSVAVNTSVNKFYEAIVKRRLMTKKALEDESKANLAKNLEIFKNKQTTTPPGTNVFSSAPDANLFTQIFPNTANNATQMALASVMHCVTAPPSQGSLRAKAGFFGFGGFDSHQGTQATLADWTELGDYVGRMLRLADARGVKLAIWLTSDGCQFQSAAGSGNWVGDDGNIAMQCIMVFNPTARPELKVPNDYVCGGFLDTVTGGGRAIMIGGPGYEFTSDPKLANEVGVLNILAAFGQIGRWSKAIGTTYTATTPNVMKFKV